MGGKASPKSLFKVPLGSYLNPIVHYGVSVGASGAFLGAALVA